MGPIIISALNLNDKTYNLQFDSFIHTLFRITEVSDLATRKMPKYILFTRYNLLHEVLKVW